MMVAARGEPYSCMFYSGANRTYLQLFKVNTLIESVPLFETTVAGIGSGGIVTLTQIISSDLVPLAESGKYQGLISMIWCLASVGYRLACDQH
jgi:MFS family permease